MKMVPPSPATATAQQIAASKAKKAAATMGTQPQTGGRIVSGGQPTHPPATQPSHTIQAHQTAATARHPSRAPTQAALAPRAAPSQASTPPPVSGPPKLPHHPARPRYSPQSAKGALGSSSSTPANGNGTASTRSTLGKSNKPYGSDVDLRDLVPPSAPQVKESNDGQFWLMNLHPWQKGYLEIKGGSLFHK